METMDPIELISEYVRCASVSTDPAYADGMAAARNFLQRFCSEIGFATQIIATEGHPVVWGERRTGAEHPTVIIYGHYDVQPADPLAAWTTPPFEPQVRNGRLYGRGTADNKGPLMVHLLALAQILKEEPDLPLNVLLLIEGEEEMGSPSMPRFLQEHGHRLKGDMILLSDSGSLSPEQITITTGLRGLTEIEVTLEGPTTDLHSGMHGGAVRNPAQALSQLLAGLYDEEGRVAIPGFYADVIEPEEWEKQEVLRLPMSEADYQRALGVSAFYTDPAYTPFEATRFRPTLEINGMGSGYQGPGCKTIIPAKAFAKLSMRLVPNQDPDVIQALVVDYIQSRVPVGTRLSIRKGHGGAPYSVVPPGKSNTPADQNPVLAQAFRLAHQSIEDAFGRPPVYLREGGSIPIIAQLKQATGLDSLMIGLFLNEDHIHAPDESFHLGVLSNGIRASKQIFRGLAAKGD